MPFFITSVYVGMHRYFPVTAVNYRAHMHVCTMLLVCGSMPFREAYHYGAFDAQGLAIVPNEGRSYFDEGAFRDTYGRRAAGFHMFVLAIPLIFTTSVQTRLWAQPLYCLINLLRFGHVFNFGNSSMFTTPPDIAVRCVLFTAVSLLLYLREYHSRHQFLLNFAEPPSAKSGGGKLGAAGVKSLRKQHKQM